MLRTCIVLTTTLATTASGLALAQQSNPAQASVTSQSQSADQGPALLQEVTITALKRPEPLEDVPVSASVVNPDELADSNVSDVSDLNRLVPALNINGTISGRAPMGIRGISSVSNEQAVGVPSGVAIEVDGVPIPSDSFDGNEVQDVRSVEVLEGPQSTLGGRTAAAGIIDYDTYDPTDYLAGGASALYTTDHEYNVNGHVSGPIADGLEYSLSAYDQNLYYPIRNLYYGTNAGQRIWGLRGKLLWIINDNISAKLTYHHGSVQQSGFNFAYLYVTPGANLIGAVPQSVAIAPITPSWHNLDQYTPVDTAGHVQDDNDGVLNLDFKLGGGYTLSSTTAYLYESNRQVQNLFDNSVYFFNWLITGGNPASCAAPAPCYNDTQTQTESISQSSEELKLVSPLDQPVSFVTGLFYSDTDVDMNYQRPFVGAELNLPRVQPVTSTYDWYGNATWKFTSADSLIAGLRYDYDHLYYDYHQVAYNLSSTVTYGPEYSTGSSNSSAAVGDIGIQHRFGPDLMAYATYSRGYSPQVYNMAIPLTSDAPLTPVGQEHVDDFEIGAKGTYFDSRLTANVALWDTKYHDYQINTYTIVPGSVSGILNIDSAGEAETRGAEFESSWRATHYTTVSAAAAYVDAVFENWNSAPCVAYYPNGVGGSTDNCVFQSGKGYVTNMSGKPMPNAPKWKLNLDAQQRIPLDGRPFGVVVDANWAYRTAAQMLPDDNPARVQGAYGIFNLSAGLESTDGRWSVMLFCDNVFNRIYYEDVEDFWSAPWLNQAGLATDTVIGQPARDAQRYGGLRLNVNF
ncbi:MAG: TonB-dependent receptor [Steroidobacteraceae bacterium]